MTTFRPLPWQVAPWQDTSELLLLTGSAGGGKSKLAAEKVVGYLMRYPGAVGIALRKAREYAAKSVVPALQRAAGAAASYSEGHQVLRFRNGSLCYIAGMLDDRQREALRSINGNGSADIIWCEEANAFTEDDFNELLARLRGTAAPWRQIILTTNPDTPTHWIYTRIMQAGEGQVYYSGAVDNPHNPAGYLDTLRRLTGPLGQRLAQGLWVGAEGMVYDQFDPRLHVLDTLPIPEEWRRWRVVDFGYTNPFVCQWWTQHPDGCLILYRELYGTRRTVRAWAEEIKRLSREEKIEATVCDHDAEDRATLVEEGIMTIPAKKDITIGLQAVMQRLQPDAAGQPQFVLLRSALVQADPALLEAKRPTCTLDEMPGYTWPKDGNGKPVKEVPVKVNDHGMDALRYAVMYADGGRPPANVPGHDPFAKAAAPAGMTMQVDTEKQQVRFIPDRTPTRKAGAALNFGKRGNL